MNGQKIFFSYARADGSAFALRLAVDLKSKGFDVWIDQEDIRAGKEWDTEIEKALEACDLVLFLETEKAVTSNNVLDEVYYALEQNKKVIPLIVVDSRTPFRLKRLQHIDFTRDYKTGLALLIAELEGSTPIVNYTEEKTLPITLGEKSGAKKLTASIFVILFVVLAGIAVFLLWKKNPEEAVTTTADTRVNTGTTALPTEPLAAPGEQDSNSVKDIDNVSPSTITSPKEKRRADKIPGAVANERQPEVTGTRTEKVTAMVADRVAGNWRLVQVTPKGETPRGYIKVEDVGNNKVNIKTYMQFYYPASSAASYLTVFNGFAGCNACTLADNIKLVVEDVAIGSHTIQKLEEDQPDGRKAGDVVLDASSNKSIRAAINLQFTNNNTALITVRQSDTVALAHGLMLAPFAYTFRFIKDD